MYLLNNMQTCIRHVAYMDAGKVRDQGAVALQFMLTTAGNTST